MILEKYEGRLPLIANQSYNRYLKEIALQLGIKKRLTTHVGRKTHATILDDSGMTDTGIARQLRNTRRVCESRYMAKSPLRIELEVKKLGLTDGMLN